MTSKSAIFSRVASHAAVYAAICTSLLATLLLIVYSGYKEPFIVPDRRHLTLFIVIPTLIAYWNAQCAVISLIRLLRTRQMIHLLPVCVSGLTLTLCTLLIVLYMADITDNTYDLLNPAP